MKLAVLGVWLAVFLAYFAAQRSFRWWKKRRPRRALSARSVWLIRAYTIRPGDPMGYVARRLAAYDDRETWRSKLIAEGWPP